MPPFEIAGLTEASEMLSDKKLKIAIVGEPKTGKSWFATTAPKPVFVADFDTRIESIRGKSGVFVKTYTDPDPNIPSAIQTLESDLGTFEYAKSQGKEIPATYVFDSATYMRKACELALIKAESKLGRGIRIGATTLKIGAGWDIINGVRAYMEYIIGRASALGNVIVVFHEQDESDKAKSTATEKKYTGRKTIQPQYLSTILALFNEVWRIKVDYQGNYSVEVKPSNEFLASSTLKLDANEKPDIMAMLAKHELAVNAAKK